MRLARTPRIVNNSKDKLSHTPTAFFLMFWENDCLKKWLEDYQNFHQNKRLQDLIASQEDTASGQTTETVSENDSMAEKLMTKTDDNLFLTQLSVKKCTVRKSWF